MKINYPGIKYTVIPGGYPPQRGYKKKSVYTVYTLFTLYPLYRGYPLWIIVYFIPSFYFTKVKKSFLYFFIFYFIFRRG